MFLSGSVSYCNFLIDIEAECQDDSMKIRVAMNGSFHGLIYSSGNVVKPTLIYAMLAKFT